MYSDPIADLLTRLRNATQNRAAKVMVPRSNVKLAISKVLKDEGFIADVETIDDDKQGHIRLTLKYGPRGERVLNALDRKSKVGCRRYSSARDLPRVLNGLGIAVVSTSHGVMSDRQCRERNIGGELICTVY